MRVCVRCTRTINGMHKKLNTSNIVASLFRIPSSLSSPNLKRVACVCNIAARIERCRFPLFLRRLCIRRASSVVSFIVYVMLLLLARKKSSHNIAACSLIKFAKICILFLLPKRIKMQNRLAYFVRDDATDDDDGFNRQTKTIQRRLHTISSNFQIIISQNVWFKNLFEMWFDVDYSSLSLTPASDDRTTLSNALNPFWLKLIETEFIMNRRWRTKNIPISTEAIDFNRTREELKMKIVNHF